jgi:hypothetical protein
MPIGEETVTLSKIVSEPEALRARQGNLVPGRQGRTTKAPSRKGPSMKNPSGMKLSHISIRFLVMAALVTFPGLTGSRAQAQTGDSPGTDASATSGQPGLAYVRPTERTKVNNYVFDAYGPYPIAGVAFAAGINQLSNAPPEWGQGVEGFSKRFGSDFAIATIGTTTRSGLAEAFKDDTLYYRCECKGALPRLSNAVISTFTARRGEDGHRVFSLPALVAPYAGSMIAVYGWFPARFGAKDAFRMGNYSLLGYMGGNIALEFFYSGPHSLLARMHLNNGHGSTVKGPN